MGMSGGAWAGPSKFPACDSPHPHSQTCKDALAGDSVEGGGIAVLKELQEGPFEFDLAAWISSGGVTITKTDLVPFIEVDPNDAGGIVAGWDVPQHFKVTITVTNESGALEENLVVYDVIPADLNPDPFLEDAETGDGAEETAFTSEGDCGSNPENCDGFDFCKDETCDGVELTSTGTCSITAAKPDGAFSGPKDPANEPFSQRHKEPELLTILITSLDDGQDCVITLHLVTDGNPGLDHISTADGTITGPPTDEDSWDCMDLTDGTIDDCILGPDQLLLHTQYEPGTCDQIASVDDDDNGGTPEIPVFNTFSLNDGVKIFSLDEDASDGFQDGFREIGPAGSLQLTANGAGVPGTLSDANIGEAFCVTP